jgi:hypothetical protein
MEQANQNKLDEISRLMNENYVLTKRIAELETENAKRVSAFIARIDEIQEQRIQCFLDWRGVEGPCTVCGGTGKKAYGSTATWHGGIGGATMTSGVCDHCWGSGDEHNHGADLRKMIGVLRAKDARIAELEAAQQWHPASEPPPQEACVGYDGYSRKVIFYAAGGQIIMGRCNLRRSDGYRWFDNSGVGYCATHWRDLPPMPEEPRIILGLNKVNKDGNYGCVWEIKEEPEQ